jgi:hypothetical protein
VFDGQNPIYLQLEIEKSVTVDSKSGNYIISGEASNENLDLQQQVVLQNALLKSKDYFLTNGVVSWDHLHKRKEGNKIVSDPECVIGEPLSVEKKGSKTFVKAMLYKGNKYVEDVVDKLRKGSTRVKLSVGGLMPVVEKVYNQKLGKAVEQVVSVLWSDLAVTCGPVNQTVSPIQLVKSLALGSGTDSAGMTGGRSLALQDIDGGKKKDAIKAVLCALATGECKTREDAHGLLQEYGVEDTDEADAILGKVVEAKKSIGGIFMDGEKDTLNKSFDEALAELEKSLKPDGGEKPPKAAVPAKPSDEQLVESEEYDEPDADNAGWESDNDEDNMDDDDDGGMPAMGKSHGGDDVDYVDVSDILVSFTKSLSLLVKENKALRAQNTEMMTMMKSMANVQLQTGNMLKSIGDTPLMRKSAVARQDRVFGQTGVQPEVEQLPRETVLAKGLAAVQAGKMDTRGFSIIEDRVNAGLPLDEKTITFLKSIQ